MTDGRQRRCPEPVTSFGGDVASGSAAVNPVGEMADGDREEMGSIPAQERTVVVVDEERRLTGAVLGEDD